MIKYSVVAKQPEAHLFEVSVTIDDPDPEGQVVSLPAWIPGSYMIRDFAKNIVRIKAERIVPARGGANRGMPLLLEKLDKHTWQTEPLKPGPSKIPVILRLTYEVYAWDLSVRSAHLDTTHGFFNPSSLCLRVEGREDELCLLELQRPEGSQYRHWRVATAMRLAKNTGTIKTSPYGFGLYEAANYDELIDHPVEMGDFVLATFEAYGIPHDVVITGRVPNLDIKRLCHDLKAICEQQIALFEPEVSKPYARTSKYVPFDRYVFLTTAVGNGYGGLEHRASTALLCSRHDLPKFGETGSPNLREGYQGFLGLASHEYFHSWNVKRIKPQVFAEYDLNVENYTRLLWFFEGFTSYYDDLVLLRAGLISKQAYLKLLEKTINSVGRGSGRLKQSVAESSFDAWTKYYRQDENAPNAIISYYTKGSLIALALDLFLQKNSQGLVTLDDLMRSLWGQFGKNFYHGRPMGVTEADIFALVEKIGGMEAKNFLHAMVFGTDELPLAVMFDFFNVDYEVKLPTRKAADKLGAKLSKESGLTKLSQVYDRGAAQLAGLAAGDVLVAIDGLKADATRLDEILESYSDGQSVEIWLFRRDELLKFNLTISAAPWQEITLKAR